MTDGFEHGLPANPYNPHAWIIGEPEIGAGTWVGAFAVLDGSGGLRIGAGCDVSCGVHVYTHNTVRRCVTGRAYPIVITCSYDPAAGRPLPDARIVLGSGPGSWQATLDRGYPDAVTP